MKSIFIFLSVFIVLCAQASARLTPISRDKLGDVVYVRYEYFNPRKAKVVVRIRHAERVEVYHVGPLGKHPFTFKVRKGQSETPEILGEVWEETKPVAKSRDTKAAREQATRQNAERNDLTVPEGGNRWTNAPAKREPKKMTPQEVEEWKKRKDPYAEAKTGAKDKRTPGDTKTKSSGGGTAANDCSKIEGTWSVSWEDIRPEVWVKATRRAVITKAGHSRIAEVVSGYNDPRYVFHPGGRGTGAWSYSVVGNDQVIPLGNNRYQFTPVGKPTRRGTFKFARMTKGSGKSVFILKGNNLLVAEDNPKLAFKRL